MVVYFSGTGNSKYIAHMLADLLEDQTYSASQNIKTGSSARLTSDKPWIFVCPVYVNALPSVFTNFIRTSSFSGSDRAWFVISCAGSFGACPAYAEKLAGEKKLRFMGAAPVMMPQNYIAHFKTKKKAECERIVTAAEPEIKKFASLIANTQPFPPVKVQKWELAATKLVLGPYEKFFMSAKQFHVNKKCTGCGVCERVCPLGNIKVVNKKPVWSNRCTHCMACIGYCPTEAIEYGKTTKSKSRYHCAEYMSKITSR